MEAVAFILIGGALFSQSWHLLGLYADGRTIGIFTAALGLGALLTLTLDPMLLGGEVADANPLAETNIMKTLIIIWAGYAVVVGAQGWWDLDERAIGFYGAFLAVASVIALIYFATELSDPYGDSVAIGMSAAALALSILSAIIFFYLAFPFTVLKLVAGWFFLFGSAVVIGIGLAIATTVIEVS